jgi:DNA mismatch endonuclease (patch repair protein)
MSARNKDPATVITAPSAGRRRNMRAIRRRDTKPEIALRSALHRAGFRYRCDFRIDLPVGRVRPDIVFTRRRVAVFIDGCFWHSCPTHGSSPKANEAYWSPKLARNRERDIRNTDLLKQAGWKVVRVWEHVPTDAAMRAVAEVLQAAIANDAET